ncbi:hypothetical protein WQ57_01625 [Mesobacillus campisalis]|uniref:Uncharacterized protein n=1 Tax=Mesobacillus campisalis TaxID=1408103 RepID=A0A0M2T5A1_9BACI|nr:hypothetical protein [Mesobacillus campisalis]KKK39995.1 hypothetical protein WQ57_01625 [Mesobacillus campisalis]
MLVKDVYLEAITLEASSLAHYIFHLLAEKKISLEDHMDQIDQADQQKVAEMIDNNFLGFHKVGIYSLKRCAKEFVFIFAGSELEAIQFFTRTFRQRPLNCHESCLDFELVRGNEVISFREMKKECERFPAVAGVFVRGR